MAKESDYSFEKNQNQPVWGPHVNKEVGIYSTSGGTIGFGRLMKPNFDTKYVSLSPVFVWEADGEHAYLERERPLGIPLGMFEKGEIIITPFPRGYLEEKVGIANRLADKKRGVLGFAETSKSK
ncbi:MAG: hypothetical protein Q8L27_01085 [archaeon]|nr:hypothetical protein [archaeon]